MAKSNFLLVDLSEKRTKKLAETITSDTSRKILNHLTEKDDSEANIAKSLGIPISTVHYHLQKLQEAKLVNVEEFHYSAKGREVNHYKLANKYIIIAPAKVSGLRQKLRGILPVGIIALGISVVLKFFTSSTGKISSFSSTVSQAAPNVEQAAMDAREPVAESLAMGGREAFVEVAPKMTESLGSSPDIAFWFFIGSMVTIGIYLVLVLVKEYWKKK
jgi:DNA-binding transcriptional ArsR family regulator